MFLNQRYEKNGYIYEIVELTNGRKGIKKRYGFPALVLFQRTGSYQRYVCSQKLFLELFKEID